MLQELGIHKVKVMAGDRAAKGVRWVTTAAINTESGLARGVSDSATKWHFFFILPSLTRDQDAIRAGQAPLV